MSTSARGKPSASTRGVVMSMSLVWRMEMWDWISFSIADFLSMRAWAWITGDVGEGSMKPILTGSADGK